MDGCLSACAAANLPTRASTSMTRCRLGTCVVLLPIPKVVVQSHAQTYVLESWEEA